MTAGVSPWTKDNLAVTVAEGHIFFVISRLLQSACRISEKWLKVGRFNWLTVWQRWIRPDQLTLSRQRN